MSEPRTVPFIPGDGVGPEVTAAGQVVFDAALAKHGQRVEWVEILAGERAFAETGEWMPETTLDAIREHRVAIKGPLTTPIGGGFRSLNVALRQSLDLYACVRPVRYFPGAKAPVINPEAVDVVIFRENTEDIYAGMELAAGSEGADKLRHFVLEEFGWALEEDGGIGLKPVSERRSKRLQRAALRYAVKHGRKRVTFVHKGNIMKFTEGAFARWGHEVAAEDEFADSGIAVDDIIADNAFQQLLIRPEDFDILATMNLNGDFLSDAVAAQVGGVGIAPGANINYETDVGVFEATHGTAPTIAGQNVANPSSLILSGAMLFEHLGWPDVATDIITAVETALAAGETTGDFGGSLSTSAFADAVAARL